MVAGLNWTMHRKSWLAGALVAGALTFLPMSVLADAAPIRPPEGVPDIPYDPLAWEWSALVASLDEAAGRGALVTAIDRGRAALALSERSFPSLDGRRAGSHYLLGLVLSASGVFAEAEGHFREAIRIAEIASRPQNPTLAPVWEGLGHVYAMSNRQGEAASAFAAAEAIAKATPRVDMALVERLGARRQRAEGIAAFLSGRDEVLDLYHAGHLSAAMTRAEEVAQTVEEALGAQDAYVGMALGQLAMVQEESGALRKAEATLIQSLDILSDAFGPVADVLTPTIDRLADLGAAYAEAGEAMPAVDIYRRVVAERTALVGEGAEPTTIARNDLANALSGAGRPSEAAPLYESVLKAWTLRYGPEHPETASAMGNLAANLRERGLYTEADELLTRSVTLLEAGLGAGHPQTVSTMANLAILREQMGELRSARDLAERVLSRTQETFGPDDPQTARAMGILAGILATSGAFAEAAELDAAVLAILTETLGPDHPTTARALNESGKTLSLQGRVAQAEPRFRAALAVLSERFGNDHPETIGAMTNLAGALADRGATAQAEILARTAMARGMAALGVNHPSLAPSLTLLGELSEARGDLVRAEPLYRRALALKAAVLPPGHPDLGLTRTYLGLLLQTTGRLPEAEAMLRQTVLETERALGAAHPSLAVSLGNLAGVLESSGAFGDADQMYRRAETIAEASLGPTSPLLATLLNNRGFLAARAGDQAAAERLFSRAVIIREANLGETHPSLAGALDNLGATLLAQGRASEARPIYERALAILAPLPASDDRDALFARAAVSRLAAGDAEGAFLASQELARGGAGMGLAASARRFAATNADIRGVLRERQDLAARLERLNDAVSDAYGRAAPARAAALQDEADAGGAALQALDRRLKAALGDAAPSGSLSSMAAAGHLRPGELLVLAQSGFETETGAEVPGLVFALDAHGGLTAATLEAGEGYVTDARRLICAAAKRSDGLCATVVPDRRGAVAPFDRGTRGALRPRTTSAGGFDTDLAYDLYRRLLGPVAQALAGADDIVFVGVGALAEMPIHLLATERSAPDVSRADTLRSVPWLIRRHAITSLPDVASLEGLRGRAARASGASKAFLGIGDPVIGTAPAMRCGNGEAIAGLTRSGTDSATSDLLAAGSVSVAGLDTRLADPDTVRGLARLPDTRCELERIARTVGSADLLLDARATEDRLKGLDEKGRLSDYRVISFATHGLRAGEAGGEPALVLTPPTTATARDDGLLTASEVSALDLDADWVILSACNTASAGSERGQALTGLAQAFFYAGARSVLVSRWPVASPAAVRLTTEAFAAMEREPGLSRGAALRLAMLAILDDPRSGAAELDPFYWAPFSLVGEGGA